MVVSNSKEMDHVDSQQTAWSNLKRNPSKREDLTGKRHKISDEMDVCIEYDHKRAVSTLNVEIIDIFQNAKKDVMQTVEKTFENAKSKVVASIQRLKCDQVGRSEMSYEVNKLAVNDMQGIVYGNEMSGITVQSGKKSEDENFKTSVEYIENSQEALIKDNLDRYEMYISDCVKTTDLIALFGHLSSAQTKELRSIYKRNPVEATKTALKMIQEMENRPQKYRLLLEALTDAGYHKVVQILNGTLIPIGSCHRNIIRQCAKHMFDRLHTSEILPYLHKKQVINNHDKQQVLQTERTESTGIAALELLDILPNRNKRWFKYFVESLSESGHGELAQIVAIEASKLNNKGSSSAGLKRTKSYKEDDVHFKMPKARVPMRESSSNDNSSSKSTTSYHHSELIPPDVIQYTTSVPSGDYKRDQATQRDQEGNLLGNVKIMNAFERPSKDSTEYTSGKLRHSYLTINETVHPKIQQSDESVRRSGSNDDNIREINETFRSITHELSLKTSDNQSKASLSERISSPISVSSDDQSCVQASRLDRGFDILDNIGDSTMGEIDMLLDTQIADNSIDYKGSEKRERQTVSPEFQTLDTQRITDESKSDGINYSSNVYMPQTHAQKGVNGAFDTHKGHSVPYSTPSPVIVRLSGGLTKPSDNHSKPTLSDKTPSTVSEPGVSGKKKLTDIQSRSLGAERISSPVSLSSDKGNNRAIDSQNRSLRTDRVPSLVSVSSNKDKNLAKINLAKTAVPPQETHCEVQQDQVIEQPLQDSHSDQSLSACDTSVSTCSFDTELDFDRGHINDQEFCANCFMQPPECTLKRCSRCLLSYYCSVQCQRANWLDHRLACSVVAEQRKAALGKF